MSAEPDRTPSFDADHFAAAVGGDREMMRHFAASFAAAVTGYLDDLRRALDAPAGRGEAWHGAAHKLKGAAATIGAHRLAALCLDAEPLPPGDGSRMNILAAIDCEITVLGEILAEWKA